MTFQLIWINHFQQIWFVSLIRYPFEWRSAHGFFFVYLFQLLGTYAVVQTSTCNYIYDIGTCETLIAIAEDIKTETLAFQEPVVTTADQIKLKKRLGKFIRFHNNGIELSRTFPDKCGKTYTNCIYFQYGGKVFKHLWLLHPGMLLMVPIYDLQHSIHGLHWNGKL